MAWQRAGLAAFFVVAGLSCSGDSRSDAGHDAGRPDAGVDSGVDAGSDAGHDAATEPDAGGGAAWIQVPGLPDGCSIETTGDGSRMGTFRREVCSDRAGCEQLVPEWVTGPITFRVDGGDTDSSRSTFHLLRTREDRLERWLVREDGSALLGIRSYWSGSVCMIAPFDVRGTRFAFVGLEPRGAADVYSWAFAGELRGSPGVAVGNLGRLSELLPVPTSDLHSLRVGETRLALESAPWHSILDVPTDGEPSLVGDPSDGGETYVAAVVGDTVIYNVFGSSNHVRAAIGGARGEVLIAPDGAGANAAVTDGVDLAWIQSYGPRTADRLELWASPYANVAADLLPRKIADIDGTNPAPNTVLGSGYVAVHEPNPGRRRSLVRVYRLADNARATILPPEERRFRLPAAYISPTIIAIPVGSEGVPPQDEALMLIELDSLDFVVP